MTSSRSVLTREAQVALGFVHDMTSRDEVFCSFAEGEDGMAFTIPVAVELGDEFEIDVLVTVNPNYLAVDGPNFDVYEDTLPHQSAFHLKERLLDDFDRLIEKEKEYLDDI